MTRMKLLEAVAEVERARNYLIRNVLLPLWPNIEPLPDLIGVCTQADNISTEIIALRARVERLDALLREAMDSRAPDLADAEHLGWSDRARAALEDRT